MKSSNLGATTIQPDELLHVTVFFFKLLPPIPISCLPSHERSELYPCYARCCWAQAEFQRSGVHGGF